MSTIYMLLIFMRGASMDAGITSQQLGPYYSLKSCQAAAEWVGQTNYTYKTTYCVPVDQRGHSK